VTPADRDQLARLRGYYEDLDRQVELGSVSDVRFLLRLLADVDDTEVAAAARTDGAGDDLFVAAPLGGAVPVEAETTNEVALYRLYRTTRPGGAQFWARSYTEATRLVDWLNRQRR
jgi:hypothetical protein